MSSAELALVVVYYAALGVLVLFALHRLGLALRVPASPPARPPDPFGAAEGERERPELPFVTVQLPLYNEAFVAERLLRAAAALDWPRDRLEIQVLDDSTDQTRRIVDRTAHELREEGCAIEALRRPNRTGFKAGALAYGLERARGSWVVIFDADFLPPEGFLRELACDLCDPTVDMVQARWSHLNRSFSSLTRAQATLLDGHFLIEQPARAATDAVFNFNGTAGAWRVDAIRSAGGWQHDTITEDLDLSYRARLAGARLRYRADVCAPGELPAEIHGFRSQQHRWAKGSVECARKLLGRVLRSRLPLRVRAEALVHLLANTTYLWLVLLATTLPWLIGVRVRHRIEGSTVADMLLALLGLGPVLLFYVRSQRRVGAPTPTAWKRAIEAIVLDVGLAVHKSRAVVEALVRHRTPFVRTPKFALIGRADSWLGNRYVRPRLAHGLPELMLVGWSLYGIVTCLQAPVPVLGPLPFLVLFATGFGWVGGLCIVDSVRQTRALLGSPSLPWPDPEVTVPSSLGVGPPTTDDAKR
jgi:hypothetical protein